MPPIEKRKIKEAEFHDILRDKKLKDNSLEFKRLTSNLKFYTITRKSQKFVDNFLIKNCQGEEDKSSSSPFAGAREVEGDKSPFPPRSAREVEGDKSPSSPLAIAREGKKVLDYCCGDGDLTIFLAKNGAEAFGIDISSVSIQNAKKEAESRGLKNASFFVMDAEKLEFDDNFFDLIVCSGILHHLNIEKAYQELSRVLKPDGKIICDEPLIYNPIFQLYRKLTSHLRTKWEVEHILKKKDIKLAEKYFGRAEKRFFHLFTLLAVPFRNVLFVFNPLLDFLGFIDSLILRLPFIKWWAWQIVFILSNPKKKNGGT